MTCIYTGDSIHLLVHGGRARDAGRWMLDAWPATERERKRMVEPYGVLGAAGSALRPGCGDVNAYHGRRLNRSKSYRRHPAAAESDAPSTSNDWRGNGLTAFSYAANRLPDYEVWDMQLKTETPNRALASCHLGMLRTASAPSLSVSFGAPVRPLASTGAGP
ncbi:hypothetical protein CORC01_14042 [Colletotrichum orchidophilum]|uniref:Uncharacterized protein n=1 Tax=Colletotrichum orchidophilum TaxID=1209926 RepID=A0A1G4ANA5_9PEZI|nr:uncharacterized protein CORC01_14042 [Colletotrichum orchidophilum]OHE90654.1 hypothetical protein CORC01_14042 [Colletotrichum orchidophilum]